MNNLLPHWCVGVRLGGRHIHIEVLSVRRAHRGRKSDTWNVADDTGIIEVSELERVGARPDEQVTDA